MSRTMKQKVVNGVTLDASNLPFAARILATVNAKNFDPAKDKDRVLAGPTADLAAAKGARDAANDAYLAAEQKARIVKNILSARAIGDEDGLKLWTEATKDITPEKPAK